MTRVGLVLGAGGIAGQAYQAGALAALEHDLGWDPRTAAVLVGSSAGSVTATLLRLGVAASDLAAFAVEAPLSLESESVLGPLGADRPELPRFSRSAWLRGWRRPSPRLLARLARRPWSIRPLNALMTLLPPGQFDITVLADRLDAFLDAWPDGLYICAARRDDGARVVFGRPGAPATTVARAVAASCAIPAFFEPVEIDGVQYFDGGVWSSTNADVLRDEALDVVIVVASMSAARGLAPTADAALRWNVHRRLDHEVRRLRARGVPVVRIEPSRETLSAMGVNAMAEDRSDRIVQASFLDTGAYLARDDIRERLQPLVARRSEHPAA